MTKPPGGVETPEKDNGRMEDCFTKRRQDSPLNLYPRITNSGDTSNLLTIPWEI